MTAKGRGGNKPTYSYSARHDDLLPHSPTAEHSTDELRDGYLMGLGPTNNDVIILLSICVVGVTLLGLGIWKAIELLELVGVAS